MKLKLLGHTISKDGLHPNQDQVGAVTHALPLHDASSLRSSLGLTLWYTEFVLLFTTIVGPQEVLYCQTLSTCMYFGGRKVEMSLYPKALTTLLTSKGTGCAGLGITQMVS